MRYDDWQTRLAQFLSARMDQPFEWGGQDCCLFACDAAQTIRDIDLARDFRSTYTTWLGAVRRIKRLGYSDLVDLSRRLGADMGLQEIHPSQAGTGDIMVFHQNDEFFRAALGIRNGSVGLVPSKDRLATVSTQIAITAFKI